MSICQFINSKGERCERKAVKGEPLCSIHKFYLKRHNIEDASQESIDDTPPFMEKGTPNCDNDRFRVYSYIRDYNELHNKTPTESKSQSGMGMEGGLMLLVPLLIKLIPHLMKYFKPHNITNVPAQPSNGELRTPQTETDIVQAGDSKNDLVPISE